MNCLRFETGKSLFSRNIFFTVKEERRTRGHGVALAKKQCRLDIRKFSFSQRIVNEWNKLSADCVGATFVLIGVSTTGQINAPVTCMGVHYLCCFPEKANDCLSIRSLYEYNHVGTGPPSRNSTGGDSSR